MKVAVNQHGLLLLRRPQRAQESVASIESLCNEGTDSGTTFGTSSDQVLVLDGDRLGQNDTSIDWSAASSPVDELLDAGPMPGQRIELEVHPRRTAVPCSRRSRGRATVPDHAAQHVQGGVGPHQGVPPVPVDASVDVVTIGGQRLDPLERVPHGVALLARTSATGIARWPVS